MLFIDALLLVSITKDPLVNLLKYIGLFYVCSSDASIVFEALNGSISWPGFQLSQTDTSTLTLTGALSITEELKVGDAKVLPTGKAPNQVM